MNFSNIHDVARHARVSISTVSRVVNNSAPVSAEKRERVLEAIKVLRFTPNPVARNLLGRETGAIGAIMPHIQGDFFANLMSGLDTAVRQHDYLLMVSASRRLEDDFISALKSMYKRVDGLIIMAPELSSDRVLALVEQSPPMVFLNTEAPNDAIRCVNFDNRGGMAKIAQHILEMGHTHVAFIGGPHNAFDARERYLGFLATVPKGFQVTYYPGDFTFECGYSNAMKILKTTPRPTVIAAANDLSALGVVRALLENGVRIPDEMAITGFDGTASGHFSTPSITTVNVPVRLLAENAVRLLVNQISDAPKCEESNKSIPVDLIVRESSRKQYTD